MTEKYAFYPYQKSYVSLAEHELDRIFGGWEGTIILEHVGSSAVPGLGGKNIVDLYAWVPEKHRESFVEYLTNLGYEHRAGGDDAGVRMFWVREVEGDIQAYHLHLALDNREDMRRVVAFRDFLRSHADYRQRYAEAKIRASQMAQNTSGDKAEKRSVYMREKAGVMAEILEQIGRS